MEKFFFLFLCAISYVLTVSCMHCCLEFFHTNYQSLFKIKKISPFIPSPSSCSDTLWPTALTNLSGHLLTFLFLLLLACSTKSMNYCCEKAWKYAAVKFLTVSQYCAKKRRKKSRVELWKFMWSNRKKVLFQLTHDFNFQFYFILQSNLTHLPRSEFVPGIGQGIGKCPYDPIDNSTAIYVESGNPGGLPALVRETSCYSIIFFVVI